MEKVKMKFVSKEFMTRCLLSNCIYFLYKNEKIVYIGETSSLFYRIKQHLDSNKDFDTFSYMLFNGSDKQRKHYESQLINKHKPIYNIKLNTTLKKVINHNNQDLITLALPSYLKKDTISYKVLFNNELMSEINSNISTKSNVLNDLKSLLECLLYVSNELSFCNNIEILSSNKEFVKFYNTELWRVKTNKLYRYKSYRKELELIVDLSYYKNIKIKLI